MGLKPAPAPVPVPVPVPAPVPVPPVVRGGNVRLWITGIRCVCGGTKGP